MLLPEPGISNAILDRAIEKLVVGKVYPKIYRMGLMLAMCKLKVSVLVILHAFAITLVSYEDITQTV